jgi:hypothetical protein
MNEKKERRASSQTSTDTARPSQRKRERELQQDIAENGVDAPDPQEVL